jgi:protein-tyrosine phosphatase
MQITAGSLSGTFGPESQQLAESMLAGGLVHFIATDGHGPRARRPLMRRAFERATELAGIEIAIELCNRNPGLVASGQAVQPGCRQVARHSPSTRRAWWRRSSAA